MTLFDIEPHLRLFNVMEEDAARAALRSQMAVGISAATHS